MVEIVHNKFIFSSQVKALEKIKQWVGDGIQCTARASLNSWRGKDRAKEEF